MRSLKWWPGLCLVVALLATSLPAFAGTQSSSGQIDLGATVPGPPPSTAPTIDTPANNVTFTNKLIDVNGTCTAGLTVRIFRNAVFAGSAFCQPDNTYALQIDLTEGRNDLLARQYDSLNQSSPDSNVVTVFYSPPGGPSLPGETPEATPGASSAAPPNEIAKFQFVIDYDYSFRGITINSPFHLPIHFIGGTPPFIVTINWGDGQQDVISRDNTDPFFADHIYKTPGVKIVVIHITDKNGNEAFLQFVLIVNGKAPEAPSSLAGIPAIDMVTYIAVPAVAVGAIGLGFGVYFGHRWRVRLKAPQAPHDKNPPPQA